MDKTLPDDRSNDSVDKPIEKQIPINPSASLARQLDLLRPPIYVAASLGRELNQRSIDIAASVAPNPALIGLRRNFAATEFRSLTAHNSKLTATLGRLNRLYSVNTDTRIADVGIHNSWRREFDRSSIPVGAWHDLFRGAIPQINKDMMDLARSASRFKVGELAASFGVEKAAAAKLHRSFHGFEHRYADLVQSFNGLEDLARRPAFVLPGATQEVIATGRVLGAVGASEEHPIPNDWEFEDDLDLGDFGGDSDLIELFRRIDPVYVSMYSGALVALDNDNPDRERHVLISLRELSTKLLHELAPNKAVKPWIAGRGDESLMDDGKPTRRARMVYIFRNLSDQPLSRFVQEDAATMTKLFDLYNKLHKKKTGVSDKQLRVIVLRTESFWRYVLQVLEMVKS